MAAKKAKEAFTQLAVEPYGGGLWHTWFDRDLGLAGRVVLKDHKDKVEERLINLSKPLLRIPSLAIHLDRSVREAFKINPEVHLMPILGLGDDSGKALLELLGLEKETLLLSHELCLYDLQEAALGGLHDEFVLSARLDNLTSSYCALEAALEETTAFNDHAITIIAMFDDEECGSESAWGANSSFLEAILERIVAGLNGQKSNSTDALFRALCARSLLVSADMAHGVHPNYPEAHDEGHRPHLGKGLAIKYNSNGRYATSAIPAAHIKRLAGVLGVPIQEFMVRNDCSCGSTIGPMLSARLGVMAVDLGIPQLAMHSIREIAAVSDILDYVRFFRGLFEHKIFDDNNL